MPRSIGVLTIAILTVVLSVRYSKLVAELAQGVLPRKYSGNSRLHTATRVYTNSNGIKSEETYQPCDFDCPWESYVSNSEFQAKVAFRDPFSVEDDQKVTALRKQLACVPFSFGYSQEKGSQLFPPYAYPPCSSLPSSPRPTLHLTNSSFSMTCPEGLVGKYVVHPRNLSRTNLYFFYDFLGKYTVSDYVSGPVADIASEYVFAGCQSEFNQAQMIPIFSQKAYQRAKETMRKRANGRKLRPMNVIFLAIDSFSRHHFYRKLNDTVRILNEFNAEKQFTVFDFKLHNIIGLNSPGNMVPMFTNQSLDSISDPPYTDRFGSNSLWSIAKSWGFVTFLGFESCGSAFTNYIGKSVGVDHQVSSFYCICRLLGMEKDGQQCIGPHMSHYYLLNYTHAFSGLYKGVNQFVYVHLNAAHEDTGQHAQTLDSDLALFLKQYTEDFGKDSDIAIIIQGDHGMAFGHWSKDVEADQEYNLPAMFLITSTELLERIPSSFDALWHNTFRLVSKRDFRATVLSLFGEPYGGTYPVHEEEYLQDAFILTREKVTDSRVCNGTHIEPWYCSCLEAAEEIPLELLPSSSIAHISGLISQVIYQALLSVNAKVYTSTRLPVGMLCQKLTFRSITRVSASKITNKSEQFKVEFSINELSAGRIEAIAIVTSLPSPHSRPNDFLTPYTYLGFPVTIRVCPTQMISVKRNDKYAGHCETISRGNGLDGEFCICNDLVHLRACSPRLFYY